MMDGEDAWAQGRDHDREHNDRAGLTKRHEDVRQQRRTLIHHEPDVMDLV